MNGIVSALLELTSGFDQEFTGRENIYLKGRILGLRDEEIAKLEPGIVEFAELEEYIDQPVRTYSSGMKARLGFSVCVNIHPEILIVTRRFRSATARSETSASRRSRTSCRATSRCCLSRTRLKRRGRLQARRRHEGRPGRL